jgi:hypothetical protein
MAGVVLHAGERGNQRRDARQRPQDGGVPVGERAPQQCVLHLAELGRGKLGRASGPPGRLQAGRALPLPGTVPAADGLAAHSQRAHDFGLGLAFLEQPRRLQPALLQSLEIPLASGAWLHAQEMPCFALTLSLYYARLNR